MGPDITHEDKNQLYNPFAGNFSITAVAFARDDTIHEMLGDVQFEFEEPRTGMALPYVLFVLYPVFFTDLRTWL